MFFVELNQFKAFLKPLKNVTLAMLSSEFVIYIFLQSNILVYYHYVLFHTINGIKFNRKWKNYSAIIFYSNIMNIT